MAQIVKLRRSSVSGQKPNNTNLQLGELALNTTDGKVFMAVSGSGGPSVQELIVTNTVNTGSIGLLGAISASVISGSFIGNASGLTNVPFVITGSDVDGNSYDKAFTKLQFDDSTGLNVSESAPGTAFISIGSHFRDIFVSGSGMLRATGSDAFEVIGDGGVDITVSNTDTNTNGYTKELKFSTTTLSSSLNGRIDNITGSLNSFTSSFNSFTTSFGLFSGSVNEHISALDNFTSSVVYTSQTSSMTVLSASYALTAAFALNAGAGGGGGGGISDGAYAELNQTIPSTTWTFNHNLGQKYPIFQIFDSNDNVIIPSQITAVNSDSATITFPSAQSGRAIASLGTGPGGMTQQFSAATTWSLSHNMGTDYPIVTVYNNNRRIIFPQEIRSIDSDTVEVYFSTPVAGYLNVAKGGHIISGSIDVTNINLTGSNIVSSSAQISAYGYATTGSNTFNGTQTINGCLNLNNARICSTATTISSNTQIFDLSSFDGAFFDYVIKSGSNMRGGTIMSVWDGTNSSYNETTTIDLGNTTAVGFNVSGTGKLNATIASGTWTVEVLYRALGDGVVFIEPTATPIPTSTPVPTATPASTSGPTPTPTPTSTTGTWGLYQKAQSTATDPNNRYTVWVRYNNGAWSVLSSNATPLTYYTGGGSSSIASGATLSFALTRYNDPNLTPIEFGAGNNGPYTGYCGFDNPYTQTFNATPNQYVYINVRMSGGDFVSCVSTYPTPTPTLTSTPTPTPTATSVPATSFLVSSGSTAPDYCSGLFGTYQTIYGNASDWLSITRFFTNSSMTTPFNGANKYYGNSNADYGVTLQINSQGYVINNYAC